MPLQDEEPPGLPERNQDPSAQRVNMATQKLHEILTTPRKPRSRSHSQGDPLSPIKSPQRHPTTPAQHAARTPGCSPSSAAGECIPRVGLGFPYIRPFGMCPSLGDSYLEAPAHSRFVIYAGL